jgi:hypothetical protein
MHKVDCGSLLRILQEFSGLGQILMDALAMPNALSWDRALNFPLKNLKNMKEQAISLRDMSKSIELGPLSATADRLVSYLDKPEPHCAPNGMVRCNLTVPRSPDALISAT